MKPSIDARLSMLRLGTYEFAKIVGVNPKTVWTWRHGRSPHPIIAKKVEAELDALEVPLRDHLCSIHGIPNGE